MALPAEQIVTGLLEDEPEFDVDNPAEFIRLIGVRWTLLFHAPRGHRYYQDDLGRIAVADDSIQFKNRPDTTDDGLLIVDKTRPISANRHGVHIPVVEHGHNYAQGSILASHEEYQLLRPYLHRYGSPNLP